MPDLIVLLEAVCTWTHSFLFIVQHSFSACSCAASLLRALIGGNPADRTQDRLSETILTSFDTDLVGSTMEGLLLSLVETTYLSVHSDAPNLSIRWHPF